MLLSYLLFSLQKAQELSGGGGGGGGNGGGGSYPPLLSVIGLGLVSKDNDSLVFLVSNAGCRSQIKPLAK